MDYPGLGMLSGLTLICAVLAVRAFRARRRWVKLAGGLPMALLGAIFGAAAILALVGYGKLNATRPNPVPQLTATIAPQLVADGERFARTCASCHAANGQLPLTGQDFLAAESDLAIGDFWAPNLTPAGLADWSDGEIVRAIREGVGRDGRSLLYMPSATFRNLSDSDVLALLAYLRTQPATSEPSPARRFNVLGAILIATIIPDESFSAQPPLVAPVVGPDRGPTAAYGGYLVSGLGCQSCHGANLTGGTPGDFNPPPGPNLTTLPQRLTVDAFIALLRTGTYSNGQRLSTEMPWQGLVGLSDDDLRAIYAHLEQIGPQSASQSARP